MTDVFYEALEKFSDDAEDNRYFIASREEYGCNEWRVTERKTLKTVMSFVGDTYETVGAVELFLDAIQGKTIPEIYAYRTGLMTQDARKELSKKIDKLKKIVETFKITHEVIASPGSVAPYTATQEEIIEAVRTKDPEVIEACYKKYLPIALRLK